MEQIAEGSPHPTARTIGVVFLLYFLTAFLAALLTKGLVVPGDAAATAGSILAHEALYRSGFAVGLIANVIYIAVTALFYRLCGPVNWSLSLVAAFCGLVGCRFRSSAASCNSPRFSSLETANCHTSSRWSCMPRVSISLLSCLRSLCSCSALSFSGRRSSLESLACCGCVPVWVG